MSNQYLIEFTDRAQLSYDRLPRPAQERIDFVINRLQDIGLRTRRIKKIPGSEEMYLGQITPALRIIFNKSDDVITVLDIVRHDKLRGFIRF